MLKITNFREKTYISEELGDGVFPVGKEQKIFLETLVLQGTNRIADLCTGCGVLAIDVASQVSEVYGVDISPRAIKFAEFNAYLNNIKNAYWMVGNLFDPLNGKFDIIMANPPYNPQIDDEDPTVFSGELGENVLDEILLKAPDYTKKCHIITALFKREGKSCSDVILQKTKFRGCDVFHSEPIAIERHVKTTWYCPKSKRKKLLHQLLRNKISHFCYGVITLHNFDIQRNYIIDWRRDISYVKEILCLRG